jgi:signal transduction histidine kinase
MIGSPSPEFIALGQSQVILLTQALGAISTVVYLAESTVDVLNPTLVPLVAYPETADLWSGLRQGLAGGSERAEDPMGGDYSDSQSQDWLHSSGSALGAATATGAELSKPSPSQNSLDQTLLGTGQLSQPAEIATPKAASPTSEATYPLVLPLAHEGIVLGMMVSTRDSLPWSADDYQQAEQVANTLAIACVMDQRNQWLQRQLNQRQLNQSDQSETFHDLLHQFRNPLTALQTFGKLMVKRLPPEDTNRPIAEGIVRESRRLQDLAQHFDNAVAKADETLDHPTTPSLGGLLLPGAVPTVSEGASDGLSGTARLAIAPAQGSGLGRSLVVKPGAIAEVALPLVELTQPLAEERGMHLVHHIPSPQPDVWLDGAALGEVLHNLIDNALKYAPPGALLWVTTGLVQHFNDQVFQGVAVGDTGQGVPLADQSQLFTRHFRGVQAQGEIPGTGLGLAIVQDLVQGMGGHIDLISPVRDGPWLPPEAGAYFQGPGALFIVWLRVATSPQFPIEEAR